MNFPLDLAGTMSGPCLKFWSELGITYCSQASGLKVVLCSVMKFSIEICNEDFRLPFDLLIATMALLKMCQYKPWEDLVGHSCTVFL